jgi:hypothetical protein
VCKAFPNHRLPVFPYSYQKGALPLPIGEPVITQATLRKTDTFFYSLQHVHDRKILHRDLKTQNIFLTWDGHVRVGDFGVSKVLGGTRELASTAVGTPYYLSPEICQNKKYNNKSDVWSLGCVLYELLTGLHPFDGASLKLLIAKITKGVFVPVTGCSVDLANAVKQMLQRDPSKRPSVNNLLQKKPFKERACVLLDPATHEDEFSHTVLHTPKKTEVVRRVSRVSPRVLPGVKRSTSTSPSRAPPDERSPAKQAPFAPRLLKPPVSKELAAKKDLSNSPPAYQEKLPRVFAVKKLTKPPSAYARPAPLPLRLVRPEPPTRVAPSVVIAHAKDEKLQALPAYDARRLRLEREALHAERGLLEQAARRGAAGAAAARVDVPTEDGVTEEVMEGVTPGVTESASRHIVERDKARREFKDRQNAVRAARRVRDAIRGGPGLESENVSTENDDDESCVIYVSGARRVRDEACASPPLPLHVAKEHRVGSPVFGGIGVAGGRLMDALAGHKRFESIEKMNAENAESAARANAYWVSKHEADRNRENARLDRDKARKAVGVSSRGTPFVSSLELLKPDVTEVLGADTVAPESEAALAIVCAGRAAAVKGDNRDDLFVDENELYNFSQGVPIDDASLPKRVAALRKRLVRDLGLEKFNQAYKSLDGMDETVDAAREAGVLVKQLGSDVASLGAVHRLLVREDALREREERGGGL